MARRAQRDHLGQRSAAVVLAEGKTAVSPVNQMAHLRRHRHLLHLRHLLVRRESHRLAIPAQPQLLLPRLQMRSQETVKRKSVAAEAVVGHDLVGKVAVTPLRSMQKSLSADVVVSAMVAPLVVISCVCRFAMALPK